MRIFHTNRSFYPVAAQWHVRCEVESFIARGREKSGIGPVREASSIVPQNAPIVAPDVRYLKMRVPDEGHTTRFGCVVIITTGYETRPRIHSPT